MRGKGPRSGETEGEPIPLHSQRWPQHAPLGPQLVSSQTADRPP